jgi:peptidoglycan/xylan/chitin deacetylase (PgdA/CDA1 family)
MKLFSKKQLQFNILKKTFNLILNLFTKKYIYLTFDDGPLVGTARCFELCKKLNAKATFFMVGMHADTNAKIQLVNNIRKSYPNFLLSNHSYSHTNEKYKTFYNNVTLAENDFYFAQKYLNIPFKIIRFPGYSVWVTNYKIKAPDWIKSLCMRLQSSGYHIVGWDLEWECAKDGFYVPLKTPEQIANKLRKMLIRSHTNIPNHIIVLMHDRMFQREESLNMLSKFIEILSKKSFYQFETIDKYPGIIIPKT